MAMDGDGWRWMAMHDDGWRWTTVDNNRWRWMHRFELWAWRPHRHCGVQQQSDGVQDNNVDLFDRSAVFNVSELRHRSDSDNYDQFLARHITNHVLL